MTHAKLPFGIQELRREYAAGRNLMELLRRAQSVDKNDETIILYSYDLQAGSYVADLKDPAIADMKRRTGEKLAQILGSLDAQVVCEAGVGEGTTLAEVAAFAARDMRFLGFDISLSRLLYARRHLHSRDARGVELFTGALGAIPLPDDAVDVVYTFHSIEPNGGREREVLTELLRVTQHHLVLVEPSNELGSPATCEHIERHGYVKNVRATLEAMGCNVVRFERWGLDTEPKNEAALIVVEKKPRPTGFAAKLPSLASPMCRLPLTRRADCMYSEEDGMAFPIVAGIPCLLPNNALVATKLSAFDER
jgi:ubiquinone/menaquinone biosynthesis C-methylase UbiE/uncharacterized protein YbaR (Trm112 family)